MILILTCTCAAILHVGYIVADNDEIFYKDMIDADQTEAKRAEVNRDVKHAISYEPFYQKIPLVGWAERRQGRDILWSHWHSGTTRSAVWTTITLIWVTLIFWKFWARSTWVEYFGLLFYGAPSFIKLMFSKKNAI